jgi:hypothetical protein
MHMNLALLASCCILRELNYFRRLSFLETIFLRLVLYYEEIKPTDSALIVKLGISPQCRVGSQPILFISFFPRRGACRLRLDLLTHEKDNTKDCSIDTL